MKVSVAFLTQLLAWTAAAAYLPGCRDASNSEGSIQKRDTGAEEPGVELFARVTDTKCGAELKNAYSKGRKKLAVPKPPAKGKKVTLPKREYTEAGLTKRSDKEIGMNDAKDATSSDTLKTQGLGPCVGVAVTFPKVTKGKPNKVIAHIGAQNGQAAITKLTNYVYNAAVEGGVWSDTVDKNHQPQFTVTYPDAGAEINDMVAQGSIPQEWAEGMENALRQAMYDVDTSIQTIITTVGGNVFPHYRRGVKAAGSTLAISKSGTVTVDGRRA